MSELKKLAALAMIVAALVSLSIGAAAEHRTRPRSIILFIGDGMGLAQARAAALYAKQALGRETTLT
jgi:alkaline phosphatase